MNESIRHRLAALTLEEKISLLSGKDYWHLRPVEGLGVPGVNIKRSPLCGRNFEYYSEDPYLAGMLAASFIDGVQSQGVGTSLKHFAVNNQESYRMVVDVVVDRRTLMEIYLAGFEIAVTRSHPLTVMCSYNQALGYSAYPVQGSQLPLDKNPEYMTIIV